MKEKVLRYLSRAYGYDMLSKHLYYVGLLVFVIGIVINNNILKIASLFFFSVSLVRTLSNNRSSRLRELARYKRLIRGVVVRFNVIKANLKDKQYKHLVCKKCYKQLRVPRGRGQIEVTCNNCRNKMNAKS